MVYNLKTDTEETNKDLLKLMTLEKFEFPDQINSFKRELYNNSSLGEKQFQNKQILMSAIQKHSEQNFYILGSSKGDINILKPTFLFVEDDFNVDNLEFDKYCLAKNYAGHASPVDSIQMCGASKMYTTSFHSENIFEWTIDVGKKDWELDHKDYKLNMEDVFLREIEKKDEYFKIVNEMLPLRNEIVELSQNIDTAIKPEVSLKLEKVIGRKAFNRRKNLFYTEDNHLIFSSATLIVKMNIPPEGYKLTEANRKKFFKEKFLLPDSQNEYTISP